MVKRYDNLSLSGYTSLMMTSQEPYIIETDFLNKLTFIVDKDAEFVNKTCWIIYLCQILKTAIRDRNKYIEVADRQKRTQGGLNFYELDSILQLQASISDSECVTTWQLLDKLLETARSLEKLSATYPIRAMKFVLPEALNEAMDKLRQIAEPIIRDRAQSS